MPDLDYNRMISVNAENDKNTQMLIGVYGGNANLSVWSNRSAIVKSGLPRTFLTEFKDALQHMVTSGKPGEKRNWTFTKYDMESKKSSQLCTFHLGRDEKALFYFGISAPNHPPMKFLPRPPMSFDRGEPMTDVQKSELAIRTIIDQLGLDIIIAMMNTSHKRDIPRTGGNSNMGDMSGAVIF